MKKSSTALPALVDHLPEWLLIAAFAFPILPLNITNILFISFSVYVLLFWIFIKPVEIWKNIRLSLVMLLPFIPYLVESVLHFNSNTMLFELQKKLLFFIAPIAIPVYIQVFRPKSIKPFLASFVLSVSVLGIISVAGLLLQNVLFTESNYENEAYLLRANFESISHLHPTYYGLFAAISALWIIYTTNKFNKWKYPLYALAVFLAFTIILVAAKMPLFILVAGFCRILFIKSKNKKALLINYALVIFFTVGLFFFTPSLKSRITNISGPGELTTIGQRQQIFDCSTDVFLENIWTGTGAMNAQQELDKCYKEKNAALESYKYNSHNQYLTIGISYGVFVLLLFFISIFLVIKEIKRSPFGMIIVVATIFIMLTESILERQMGVYFFTLFWLLLLSKKYFRKQII